MTAMILSAYHSSRLVFTNAFNRVLNAGSSGFSASPNPVAAILAGRAAGKGSASDDSNFFPVTCNLACRDLIGW